MSMHLIRHQDAAVLQKMAALKLHEFLAASATAQTPVLLLLSGGSAFSLLASLESSVLGLNVTISVLDERFTDDPTLANMTQLMQLPFFSKAQRAGCRFIDPRRSSPHDSLQQAGERFELALRAWRAAHQRGNIIVTQGMGADGHTAGIMPYPENPALFQELFETGEAWVRAYDAGAAKNAYPQRLTVTPFFLRTQVAVAVAYIEGVEKRAALLRLLSAQGALAETPARVMREMKEVVVLTTLPEVPMA